MARSLLALLLPLLLAYQAGGELLMVYSVQRHGARCAGRRAGAAAPRRRCRRCLLPAAATTSQGSRACGAVGMLFESALHFLRFTVTLL